MKLAFVFLLFISTVSMAQDPGTDPVCKEAREKHCKEHAQTPAKARFCLFSHRTAIDEKCRDMVDANEKKFKNVLEICREQIWKVCDKAFKGNVQACLRVNRDEFSGKCGDAVRALK